MLISNKIIKSIGVKLYMEYIDEKNTEYEFYKNNSTDLVWWLIVIKKLESIYLALIKRKFTTYFMITHII